VWGGKARLVNLLAVKQKAFFCLTLFSLQRDLEAGLAALCGPFFRCSCRRNIPLFFLSKTELEEQREVKPKGGLSPGVTAAGSPGVNHWVPKT